MNKIKSYKHIVINILLILICICSALVIYIVYIIKEYDVRVAERDEFFSKDNKYKVILEQAYEESIIPFAPYRTRVTVGKKVGDEWIYKDPFELSYKIGGAIRKENVTIDWIDGGVIIKVTGVEKEKDMTYRVYWEDVF